ncbi:MAG TPA: phage tail tape measure protein, partial [Rhodothermales bacterium]|nr:phage tail tape measure protein [Rhodothermales bacterium]
VAKLVRVTELSAEEAASNVARIANAFDIPITQADRIGSVLNELSNTTTALAGNIASALVRVGTAGSSIGLTADQVAGLSAVLIDSGIVAERAGTSLRNLFVRLQTESGKLAETIGITRDEFDTLVRDDALAALQTYLDALRAMPPNLRAIKIKETFGDENFLAVQSLTQQTDLLTESLETSRRAFEEGDSLNTEFARSLNSVSAQWDIFKAKLGAAATELGTRLLPLLEKTIRIANGFAESFDDVGTRLINTLKEIEGIDPELIVELETTEALRQARRLTGELEKELRSRTVKINAEFVTQAQNPLAAALTGGVAEIKFTTAPLSEIPLEQLQNRLVEINSELESFARLQIEGELSFVEQRQVDALEEQSKSIQEAIAFIQEYESARKALDVSIQAVNSQTSDITTPTDDTPIVSPEDVDRAERVLDAITRAQQLRGDLSEDQRQALADVFDAQDEITELLEIQKTLGAEAIREQLELAERRLRTAQRALAAAQEFRDAIKEAAAEIGKLEAAGVQGPIGKLFEKPKDDIKDILDSTKNGAQIISSALRQIPKGTLDDLDRDAQALTSHIVDIEKELKGMADLINEITGLANVFGDLSEGALEFSRGLGQALSNASRLSQDIGSLGTIGAAASGIGLFTGLASVFGGIAEGLNAQRESQRAQVEAFRRLQDQLRDNARAIAKNTKALLGAAQIGANVSQDQIDAGEDILQGFLGSVDPDERRGRSRGRGGQLGGEVTEESFLKALDDLDALGIEGFDAGLFEQQFLDLIASGLSSGEAARIVSESILDLFSGIDAGLGRFSNTIEGAIEALAFYSEFISTDAQDQLNFFLDRLLRIPDLPEELREQLEGLDLSTQAGRDEFKEILLELIAPILAGTFSQEGLTAEQAESIAREGLRLLDSFSAGVDEEGFTRSVQIARTITEIQANELIAIQESALFVLQDIRDILGGSGPPSGFSLPDNTSQPRDPVMVQIGDVNAGITETEVPRLMVMIEDSLRSKIRGGR